MTAVQKERAAIVRALRKLARQCGYQHSDFGGLLRAVHYVERRGKRGGK